MNFPVQWSRSTGQPLDEYGNPPSSSWGVRPVGWEYARISAIFPSRKTYRSVPWSIRRGWSPGPTDIIDRSMTASSPSTIPWSSVHRVTRPRF
jgi:hypothetical protein